MTLEEKFIEKWGSNRFFMGLLKMYKRSYSYFFGIKKEMAFGTKLCFSWLNRFPERGRKNIIRMDKSVKCKHSSFTIMGKGNKIIIGAGSRIENVEFDMRGDGNCIIIGKNVLLRNAIVASSDGGSILSIGDNTSTGKGLKVSAMESAKVQIGNDCLFSTFISIMNSDSHSIIDLNSNRRVNAAKDIKIGNHVWLGENVKVLKGVEIQDNVVIGNRSMLTKGLYQSNSVYVGSPAKLLRGGSIGVLRGLRASSA